MNQDLAQKAVLAALAGKWDEAIRVNKNILKYSPKDIEALNRLARAYAEKGNLPQAKRNAKMVTTIDPFNSIATKSLEKWKKLKKGEVYSSGPSRVKMFLEESGKTKIVNLINLGSTKTRAKLDSGDEVRLNTHGHHLTITTYDNQYVGRLPDDLSARLKQLTKYGNTYSVHVKNADDECVGVFLREVKRVKKLADIPSFSAEKIDYISFTPPELVHKKDKPNVNSEDEEE